MGCRQVLGTASFRDLFLQTIASLLMEPFNYLMLVLLVHGFLQGRMAPLGDWRYIRSIRIGVAWLHGNCSNTSSGLPDLSSSYGFSSLYMVKMQLVIGKTC